MHTIEKRDEGGLVVLRLAGPQKIKRLLIANRGEIACRVIRSCRTVGITSIAVFAEEDRESLHVEEADEAISLGSVEQSAGNPHQNAALLVKTALDANADAVHPGYGYLSENEDFAKQVQAAGLIFVGPSPETISVLGDKRQANDYLREHAPNVPLIPRHNGKEQDVATLEAQADVIGLPVMIKAAAGGGGRGMRVIYSRESLRDELSRAQSEAQRSFGSSDCLLEKYIERGKHIEVQIFGDSSGEIISLFERECSVQRRHQKIIEEAPSPSLDDKLRRDIIEAAKEIARLMRYENAGTVEFILDLETRKFYFLEVNTRVQVEHPITEETTGIDIVALQLYVAAGGLFKDAECLQDISQFGHAIECRLCAEDPIQDFMPASGKILRWSSTATNPARGSIVRLETSVRSGSQISVYFDSMIAKIVVKSDDRETAIKAMLEVLQGLVCFGLQTNLAFLQACLLHKEFQGPSQGKTPPYTTNFIAQNIKDLTSASKSLYDEALIKKFAFAIPLFLRWGLAANTSYRPFSSIRQGFRNQVMDSSSMDRDVVIAQDHADKKQNEFIFTWLRGDEKSPNTHRYLVKPLRHPSDQKSEQDTSSEESRAETKLVQEYNLMLDDLLKAPGSDEKPCSARIIHVSTQKHGSPPQEWLTSDMTIENSGVDNNGASENKRSTVHLATDYNYNTRDKGGYQRVFCHVAGMTMEYHRYTLLAYGESLRTLFQAPEAMDQMRVYKSAMPCKVLQILKKKGDAVKTGETLLVVESMKTEMKMVASADGTFEPKVEVGSAVDGGVVLCEILDT